MGPLRCVHACLLAALWAGPALGEDKKKLVGTRKATAPVIDLKLPAFEALPQPSATPSPPEPPAPARGPLGEPEVVRVQHARSFQRAPTGARPQGLLDQVLLSGTPLTTERFASCVRVKSPGGGGTRIEVVVVDPRGDTVMEADGSLAFGPRGGEEQDWTVDWSPTTVRVAGVYQLKVRLGGADRGSFPIKFAETPR